MNITPITTVADPRYCRLVKTVQLDSQDSVSLLNPVDIWFVCVQYQCVGRNSPRGNEHYDKCLPCRISVSCELSVTRTLTFLYTCRLRRPLCACVCSIGQLLKTSEQKVSFAFVNIGLGHFVCVHQVVVRVAKKSICTYPCLYFLLFELKIMYPLSLSLTTFFFMSVYFPRQISFKFTRKIFFTTYCLKPRDFLININAFLRLYLRYLHRESYVFTQMRVSCCHISVCVQLYFHRIFVQTEKITTKTLGLSMTRGVRK